MKKLIVFIRPFYNILLFCFITLVFLSCEKEDNSAITGNKLNLKSSASKYGENKFDLGEIYQSKSFPFILSNNTAGEMKDITIESGSKHFQINPSNIPVLQSSNIGFEQIIEINVLHGKKIDVIGWYNLLPKGLTTCPITISGITTQGPIKLEAEIRVNAQVFDIDLFDGEKKYLMPKDYVSTVQTQWGGSMRSYYNESGKILIENTGNVKVNIKYGQFNSSTDDYEFNEISLESGLKVQLDKLTINNKLVYIFLYGEGAITDQAKLPLNDDGQTLVGVHFTNFNNK